MDFSSYVLQLASAFAGSMGFALLFQVRRRKLMLASLGGLLAWAVYLALGPVMPQDVPRFFIASMVLTIYAEVLARVVKCPATLFLVTAAVPLIPGGSCTTLCAILWRGILPPARPRALIPCCWLWPLRWG